MSGLRGGAGRVKGVIQVETMKIEAPLWFLIAVITLLALMLVWDVVSWVIEYREHRRTREKNEADDP